jgi:bifunctional DNA-binding transcriptional regulator/antitoxin component of YhaV-PrlF toxin-antitoxin module
MEFVIISSEYKIRIPESIRNSMKLIPGDEFLIYAKEDTIVMVRKVAFSEFKGKFSKLTMDDIREELERIE